MFLKILIDSFKKVLIDSFEDFLVDQDRQFHDIDGRRVPNSKTCQFHD